MEVSDSANLPFEGTRDFKILDLNSKTRHQVPNQRLVKARPFIEPGLSLDDQQIYRTACGNIKTGTDKNSKEMIIVFSPDSRNGPLTFESFEIKEDISTSMWQTG